MFRDAQKITGVLTRRGIEYFLQTEDAELVLLNAQMIYRSLIGCKVIVEGIPTGIDTLLVREITLAP